MIQGVKMVPLGTCGDNSSQILQHTFYYILKYATTTSAPFFYTLPHATNASYFILKCATATSAPFFTLYHIQQMPPISS